MTPLPASPFITESEFVLDEAAFMSALEEPPVFIADPSPEYLDALWTWPIVEVLSKY